MPEVADAWAAVLRCPICGALTTTDISSGRATCGECGRPVLIDRPVAVTDADFDAVIAGTSVPVVVDFYADWCGPCKMMAPVLDAFARARAGRALVLKLDTDRNPQTSERYGIRGIPTMILFQGGQEIARRTGAVPARELEEMVPA